jgi:hypothetical protein
LGRLISFETKAVFLSTFESMTNSIKKVYQLLVEKANQL